MELERGTDSQEENIWKWGKDESTRVVDFKKLTSKLTTPELISIINEDQQLPKINIIEPEVETIGRLFEKFDLSNSIV